MTLVAQHVSPHAAVGVTAFAVAALEAAADASAPRRSAGGRTRTRGPARPAGNKLARAFKRSGSVYGRTVWL